MPSSATRLKNSAWNVSLSTQSVTSAQRSMSWPPSISTSGSTIGTMPSLLAQRGIAGERVRIGADAGVARHAVLADVDHRAPFGEFGAEPAIFGEPLAQAVEAFGDHFARAVRQRLDALVDLDAGQRAGLLDQLDQRRAVLGVLADGLVVEDDAGNIFRHRLVGAEQHFAIVAPVVGGAIPRRAHRSAS